MKKLLALLLCLVMLLSVVACNATSESTTEKPTTEQTTSGTAAQNPVLKVAIAPEPNCTDYDDNDMTKFFEEQIGADIEWIFLPVNMDDAITKINLTRTSRNQKG